MTGQDAVNVAETFNKRLNLDGVIMTKLDGDARGGAALSVKEITGKPIKFLGMGESLDKLEEFRPEGLASRILGMGDIVGLVKDFEQVVDAEKAEEDALRMLKGKFDMQDFLEQIRLIQKMGSLKDLFEKLPFFGGGLPEGVNLDDRELDEDRGDDLVDDARGAARTRRCSSRPRGKTSRRPRGKQAKRRRADFDPSRVKRIAKGSGRSEQRGQGAAAEVRADAPDDGAARRVDRPDGQDPRLQAVLADEEAREHGHQRADGRGRWRRRAGAAMPAGCPDMPAMPGMPTGNVPGPAEGLHAAGHEGRSSASRARATSRRRATSARPRRPRARRTAADASARAWRGAIRRLRSRRRSSRSRASRPAQRDAAALVELIVAGDEPAAAAARARWARSRARRSRARLAAADDGGARAARRRARAAARARRRRRATALIAAAAAIRARACARAAIVALGKLGGDDARRPRCSRAGMPATPRPTSGARSPRRSASSAATTRSRGCARSMPAAMPSSRGAAIARC